MRRYNAGMLNRLAPCLVVLIALVAAAPASAQGNLDRVQVGVPGTVTRDFATSLSLRLNIPSGYTRDCCYDFVSGAWVGPAVHYSDDPGRSDLARTTWKVSYSKTSRSIASVARAAMPKNYREVGAKKRTVRHVLGGHNLGKVKAFSVIDQLPDFAFTKAALVIDLGRHVKATILFSLANPSSDSDGSGGSVTVNGLAASAYNARAAEATLSSVQLEGALPLARVNAKAAGNGVRGKVLDIAGQAVGQAKLQLQRRAGGGWRTVGKGKSSLTGTFSLSASGKGSYRVVATLAKATVRSKAVRVG